MGRIKLTLFVVTLLIGTASSLFAQPTCSIFLDPAHRQYKFQGQAMALDNSGNVWAIYNNHGMVRFDGQSNWTVFDSTDGLFGGQINAVIRDVFGHMWVSADSGIASYINGSWNRYTIHDELSSYRKYGALAADSEGNIWVAASSPIPVGFNGGILDSNVAEVYRFNKETWTNFPISVLYPEGFSGFNSLSVAPDGTIWGVGTQPENGDHAYVGGLWKLTNGTWTTVNADDGSGVSHKLNPIWCQATGNGVWVAFDATVDGGSGNLYDGGVNFYDGTRWTNGPFSSNRFQNVWLAPNHDVYFASKDGIVITRGEEVIDSIPTVPSPFGGWNPGDTQRYHAWDMQFADNNTFWDFTGRYNTPDFEVGFEKVSMSLSGVKDDKSNPLMVEVWPNPASSYVFVSWADEVARITSISIYDVCGRNVFSSTQTGTFTARFDVHALPPAPYRVIIDEVGSSSDPFIQTVPLIINR